MKDKEEKKYPIISYPEVRKKFMDETDNNKIWAEGGYITDEYFQWLEDYVLSHQ